MKKKILPFKGTVVLSIMMITALLAITGCSLPPFNTKTKIGFDTSAEPKFTVSTRADVVNIPVKIENKVGAELKSLKVYSVNGTLETLIFETTEPLKFAAETVTTVKIKAFSLITDIEFKAIKTVVIKATVKDVNGNDEIELAERVYEVVTPTVNQDNSTADTKPAAVTKVAAVLEDGVVNVSWEDTKNTTGYITYAVYRQEGSLTNTAVAIATGISSINYIDRSVGTGKEYYYSIVAVKATKNGDLISDASSEVKIKILSKVNYQVTNLTASASDKSKTVKLTWTAPASSTVANTVKVKGYIIYRKDTKGIFKEIGSFGKAAMKEYIDEDASLVEKASYTYKVTVYDDQDQEYDPDSDKDVKWPEVTIKDITSPGTPAGLKAELMEGYQVKVSWTKNAESDIKEYRLYYSTDVLKLTSLGSGVTTTTIQGINFVVVNCLDLKGQSVYFKLRAVDGEGNFSDYTDVEMKKLDYTSIIPEPTKITLKGGAGIASMSWIAPVISGESMNIGIVGYEVRFAKTVEALIRNTTGSVILEKTKGTSILTTNTALSVNPGEYYFTVKAIGAAGEIGKESSPVSAYVYDNITVLKQQEVRAEPTIDGVEVKWDTTIDSSVTGYVIMRAVDSSKIEDFSIVKYIAKTGVSSDYFDSERKEYRFVDTTARQPSTTYYYAIAGYKTMDSLTNLPILGNLSGAKAITVAEAPAKMGAPGVRSNLPNNNYISVSWAATETAGIAGYKVYVSRTPDGKYYYMGMTGGTFMGIDVKPAQSAIGMTTTASSFDMATMDIENTTLNGVSGVTTINKWTKPDDGDRLYYYSNIEKPDGKIEQRIQYLDLPDPFLFNNEEGERRREFFFKVSAINKNGLESQLSDYKMIDLVPPKEDMLGVFAGVTAVSTDPNTLKKTFDIAIGCNDLGVSARYYRLYKEVGSKLPSIGYISANMHWLDINGNNKYRNADGIIADAEEMFYGSRASGTQIKSVLDTRSGLDQLGSWTDQETLEKGTSQNIIYTVVAMDDSKNESSVFDFTRYMYTSADVATTVLTAGNKIKMPKLKYDSVLGKIKSDGNVEYIVTDVGGYAFIGNYPLGKIGETAKRGYGWVYLGIANP